MKKYMNQKNSIILLYNNRKTDSFSTPQIELLDLMSNISDNNKFENLCEMV